MPLVFLFQHREKGASKVLGQSAILEKLKTAVQYEIARK